MAAGTGIFVRLVALAVLEKSLDPHRLAASTLWMSAWVLVQMMTKSPCRRADGR